jgi:hypothetical protein
MVHPAALVSAAAPSEEVSTAAHHSEAAAEEGSATAAAGSEGVAVAEDTDRLMVLPLGLDPEVVGGRGAAAQTIGLQDIMQISSHCRREVAEEATVTATAIKMSDMIGETAIVMVTVVDKSDHTRAVVATMIRDLAADTKTAVTMRALW